MSHPLSKPARAVALGVLASVALAACSLIPPQTIANPLGIDGIPARLAPITAPAPTGFVPSQIASCADFGARFSHCAALDGAPVPPLQESRWTGIVARFEAGVGIRRTIELLGADEATAPSSLTLARGVLDLHVEDVGRGLAFDPAPVVVAPAEPVVFLLDSEGCSAAGCTYSAPSTAPLEIPIVVAGSDLDLLFEILGQGGEDHVSGTLAYEVEGAPERDVRVTLSSPEGVIRF